MAGPILELVPISAEIAGTLLPSRPRATWHVLVLDEHNRVLGTGGSIFRVRISDGRVAETAQLDARRAGVVVAICGVCCGPSIRAPNGLDRFIICEVDFQA